LDTILGNVEPESSADQQPREQKRRRPKSKSQQRGCALRSQRAHGTMQHHKRDMHSRNNQERQYPNPRQQKQSLNYLARTHEKIFPQSGREINPEFLN
jgi:hypothetical protein